MVLNGSPVSRAGIHLDADKRANGKAPFHNVRACIPCRVWRCFRIAPPSAGVSGRAPPCRCRRTRWWPTRWRGEASAAHFLWTSASPPQPAPSSCYSNQHTRPADMGTLVCVCLSLSLHNVTLCKFLSNNAFFTQHMSTAITTPPGRAGWLTHAWGVSSPDVGHTLTYSVPPCQLLNMNHNQHYYIIKT